MNLFRTLEIKQSGFSLIEVMIGGSIIVGVSMAGYGIYTSQTVSQGQIEEMRDLEIFHKNLVKSLQSAPNCNATMQPWHSRATVPDSDIQRISFCSSACSDAKRAQDVAPSEITVKVTESLANPTDGSQWIDGKRRWEVRELSIPNPATRSGIVNLNVTYRLDPNRSARPKSIVKAIPLNLKFTRTAPFQFITCSTEKEANIRSLLLDMCDTLGSASTSGRMVTWDEATQRCVVRPNPLSCPFSNKILGTDENGSTICETIVNDVDTTQLVEPTDADCTSARRPQVIVRGDFKLQAICL